MGLIIGLEGKTLTLVEQNWLRRQDVCGVILFTRNFDSRAQICALVRSIRAAKPGLIICVDQEGGRVQRFRPGFVDLPALECIGALYAKDQARAREACALHARLMASDILSVGIDLSFAPVADLLRGNLAIGNRAFSAEPAVCAELTALYAVSMQATGMAATLKHFPGHGSVLEDTHFDLAIDQRPVAEIFSEDLLPFAAGILRNARAVMTAHVSYPSFDSEAAGYSMRWLMGILRGQLGFTGIIFSDDVGMLGGANVGSLDTRIRRHYEAGCDVVLVCSPEATHEVMQGPAGPAFDPRITQQLQGARWQNAQDLQASEAFSELSQQLHAMLLDA
jgi:beta-N-acetylhexosaminidase